MAERAQTYHNTRKMSIQNTTVLVITAVYLQEMGAEVLHYRLVIVCSVSEGGDAEEHHHKIISVWSDTYYLETRSPLSILFLRMSVLSVATA